jgi:hypothetical protein
MVTIRSVVETCATALAGVTPQNLTPAVLDAAMEVLQKAEINEAIDQYARSLPSKPEDNAELPEWQSLVHQNALDLNHSASLFNKELSRIKDMQQALNIPQLDTLIHAAQQIIRPLYNFTSQLSV